MSLKKSILLSTCALAITGMTGMATAAKPTPEPMFSSAPEKRNATSALPTRVAPVLLPSNTPVKEIVIETDNPELAAQRLFAQIPAASAPTGILIERDAPDVVEAVRALDGSADSLPTSLSEFNYIAAQLAAKNGLFDLDNLERKNSRLIKQTGSIPITAMLVKFDTFGENPSERVVLDQNQQFRLTRSVADATDTKVMFAISIDKPALSYLNDSFILRSDNFISNMVQPSQVRALTISFAGGAPQSISFDQPFKMADKFIGADSITASLSLQVAGQTWVGSSIRPYDQPTAEQVSKIFQIKQLRGPETRRVANSRSNPGPFHAANCEIPCYNLDSVEQQIDFVAPTGEAYERGVLYPRAYPINELRANELLGPTVVFVDGFDIEGNRTLDSLYEKIPDMFPIFHKAGYNVIMLDYEDGTNWIQANALVLREFLTNHLSHYVSPEFLDDTVVIGRSMGGLVSRYALRTAELAGEDHHVNLFMSLDTPHLGANAPAGIFHAFEWAKIGANGIVGGLGPVRALDSPAAAQQLRRLPNEEDVLVAPEQHVNFMTLMAELGVPQDSRNFAISNGSGTGSTQLGRERLTDLGEANPSRPIIRANAPVSSVLSFLTVGLLADVLPDLTIAVDTNHVGRVFLGESTKRYLFVTITKTTENFVGDEANFVDLAPGGNISQFSQNILGRQEVIDAPGFVPTISGLMYGDAQDIFAIPTHDDALLEKTPFDEVFFDQCNTEHATFTENVTGVVVQELLANLDGSAPPQVQRPTERCEDVNIENLCFIPVTLFGKDRVATFGAVNFDGEHCEVSSSIPEGRTGFVFERGLYLEPATNCPAGSIITKTGCGFTEIPDNVWYSYTTETELVIIADPSAQSYCPRNTTFKSRAGTSLHCELRMAAGYDGYDLRINSVGDLEYKVDLSEICPDGRVFKNIAGRNACEFGQVPENTSGLIKNDHFAYTAL